MQSKIVGKREVAKDTWEIQFARPKEFNFAAGQFMEVVLPKLRFRPPLQIFDIRERRERSLRNAVWFFHHPQ